MSGDAHDRERVGFGRRDYDQFGEWKGQIEARVVSLEREMDALADLVRNGTIAQTQLVERVSNIASSIGELKNDIARAEKKVEEGRDAAVAEVRMQQQHTIDAMRNQLEGGKLGRREWLIALLIAVIGPVITAIVVANIVVGSKP